MNIFDLIVPVTEEVSLDEIVLSRENKLQIAQLIKEHTYIKPLLELGLPVNTKILLHGSSGCGKTMTAKAIAKALNKSILILNLSNIVSSRIGETSQNLKQLFDKVARERAVLFLDEFDQIGKARSHDDKDVGEMRRLVNTLIQQIDYLPSDSLLICATNHVGIIDTALLRRFQLKIGFEMPSRPVLDDYYTQLLGRFPTNLQLIDRKFDISFAEARDYTFTLMKAALITEWETKNT